MYYVRANKNMHQSQVLTVAYSVEIFAYLTFKAKKEDCKDFSCQRGYRYNWTQITELKPLHFFPFYPWVQISISLYSKVLEI